MSLTLTLPAATVAQVGSVLQLVNKRYVTSTGETKTYSLAGGVTPPSTNADISSMVTNFVGSIVNSIGGFLVGLMKGGTKHATYDQVEPQARKFDAIVYPLMRTAYGADLDKPSTVTAIQNRFRAALSTWWTATQNQQIANGVQHVQERSDPISWMLNWFFLWWGTNVDLQAGPEENAKLFRGTFGEVFVNGLLDAGLDPLKLTGKIPTPQVGSGQPGAVTAIDEAGIFKATPDQSEAGVVSWKIAGAVLILLAVGFVISKSAKGG